MTIQEEAAKQIEKDLHDYKLRSMTNFLKQKEQLTMSIKRIDENIEKMLKMKTITEIEGAGFGMCPGISPFNGQALGRCC